MDENLINETPKSGETIQNSSVDNDLKLALKQIIKETIDELRSDEEKNLKTLNDDKSTLPQCEKAESHEKLEKAFTVDEVKIAIKELLGEKELNVKTRENVESCREVQAHDNTKEVAPSNINNDDLQLLIAEAVKRNIEDLQKEKEAGSLPKTEENAACSSEIAAVMLPQVAAETQTEQKVDAPIELPCQVAAISNEEVPTDENLHREADEVTDVKRAETQKRITKICIAVMICMHAVLTFGFIAGAFSPLSDSVSIIGAVEKIMSIFSLDLKLWYYYLSSLAQGIAFIVLTILLIKSFVKIIKYGIGKNLKIALSRTRMELAEACNKCVFYVLFVSILTDTTYGADVLSIFIVAFSVLVLCVTAYNFMYSGNDLSVNVSNSFYYLIKCALLFAVGVLFTRPAVKNIFRGVVVTFTSVDLSEGFIALNTLYQALAVDVLYLLLFIKFLDVADAVLIIGVDGKRKWKQFMIFVSVYMSIELFMVIALADGLSAIETIENFYDSAKNFSLPILISSIAGYLIYMCPPFKNISVKPAANESEKTDNNMLSN